MSAGSTTTANGNAIAKITSAARAGISEFFKSAAFRRGGWRWIKDETAHGRLGIAALRKIAG